MNIIKKLIFTIGVLSVNCVLLSAQNLSLETMFEKAKSCVLKSNTSEAQKICVKILRRDSLYHDAMTLLARTYAWDNDYQKGLHQLNFVLDQKPEHMDALKAKLDITYWSKNYKEVVKLADKILLVNADQPECLLKKADALMRIDLNNDEIPALLKKAKSNAVLRERAIQLLSEYRNLRNKTSIQIQNKHEYQFEPFVKNRNLTSVSLDCKTEHYHSVFRYSIGDVYSEDEHYLSKGVGHQLKMDLYPEISEKSYLHVNYGFGWSGFFPKHRIGAESYFTLRNMFELSAGFRYLFFPGDDTHVSLITASIGKYYRNYYYNLRSFVNVSGGNLNTNFIAKAYRYMGTRNNRLGIELIYGKSPDDDHDLAQLSKRITKFKFLISYQKPIYSNSMHVITRLGYSSNRYSNNTQYNSIYFDFGVGLNL
jgi:YaiO family outer membrane protein